MKKKREKREKSPKKALEKESEKKTERKVLQSTQQQIPIKEITSQMVITADDRGNPDRLVKILEIKPICFRNSKVSQQNIVRSIFQQFLRSAPNNFQLKSLSTPANLAKQIAAAKANGAGEENAECKKLSEEYCNSLEEAQRGGVERKFYIAFSNDKFGSLIRPEDMNKAVMGLNADANRIMSGMESVGNRVMDMGAYDVAELLYKMYNRNTCYKESFDERLQNVGQKYVEETNVKDPYIPPVDYIAPHDMQFNDKKLVVCDGKIYSFLYITGDGYPESAVCDWLDMFVNSNEGIDVDVFVRKKNRNDMRRSLRQLTAHSLSDLDHTNSGMSDSYQNASSKYYAATYLFDCLKNGEDIYDVSTIITVCGDTVTEVSDKIDSIIDTAKGNEIKIRDLQYQEEIAFKSVLPLNYIAPAIERKAKRNMQSSAVSTLYMFNTSQLIHEGGLNIAQSINGSAPIIPDFWNTHFFTNPHIFLCGTSGAGKTSAMELISLHARVMNIPVFIIAPEKQKDYKRLCDALGGQFIDIGQGSQDRINIMAIMENDVKTSTEIDEIYGKDSRGASSYLAQRIGVVSEFVHTFYSSDKEYMPPKDRSILNNALVETYRRRGITEDNNSLWVDSAHTSYKTMPVLSELVKVLKEMGKDAETLAASIEYFTTGAAAFFDGQTNIDVKNKYFVIGIENNTKQTLPLAAYVAEDFCQMKIRSDTVNRKMFIIDEEWAMLGNHATAEKLKEDSKLLRGYQCSMVNGTQQMSDVLSCEEGQAILKDSDTRIIMKHKDEDVRYLAENIDITTDEMKHIKSFTAGQALFIANEIRIPIKFCPTETEELLTWNDEKTLKKWAKHKRNMAEKERLEQVRKEKERYYEELVDNAKKEDEVIVDASKNIKPALTSEEYLEYLKNKRGELKK